MRIETVTKHAVIVRYDDGHSETEGIYRSRAIAIGIASCLRDNMADAAARFHFDNPPPPVDVVRVVPDCELPPLRDDGLVPHNCCSACWLPVEQHG